MENLEVKSIASADALKALLELVIVRQNEQATAIAALRAQLEAIEARQDEAQHFTTEEFGQQVVEQVMLAMPAIQAAAMKKAKAKPVARGGRR